MAFLKQKEIPLAIVAICGVLMIIRFLFDVPGLNETADEVVSWGVILSAFAVIWGGVGLVRKRVTAIARMDWHEIPTAVFGLVLLVLMVVFDLYLGTDSYQYKWFFSYWYMAVRGTSYASCGFYTFSTYFRAFRLRNIDTAFLLAGWFMIVFRNWPMTPVFAPWLDELGVWVASVGQMGGSTAFSLSAAIGMAMLGLRTMVGMETAAIGMIPTGEVET
jgi:hypothetical protein